MKKFIGLNRQIRDRLRHSFVWIGFTLVVSWSASLLIFLLERDVNPELDSIGETFWWWVVTITGLGYGDKYPVTSDGKIVASFVILSGLLFFAIVISEVADLIRITYERKEKGIIRVNYKNHIVIYGYTSLTAGVVKLLRRHFGASLKIVIISNEIEFNPFPKETDFIYANPINKDTFIECNAEHSLASIILANDKFSDPDAYSLVIAAGVEMYNPKAVTIVEIMDDEYRSLYKEGNIEAFIKRRELLKDLISKTEDSKLLRIIEKETSLEVDNDNDQELELI